MCKKQLWLHVRISQEELNMIEQLKEDFDLKNKGTVVKMLLRKFYKANKKSKEAENVK